MSDVKVGCGFCSWKRRVLNMEELHVGQHICEPGRNMVKYRERNHDLKAPYYHHAIIADIKERSNYQATLVLIHYTEVMGFKTGSIQKKNEKRDLEYDEIYIVEYKHSKYSPKEIVQRAESQVKEGIDTDQIKDVCNDSETTIGVENDTERLEGAETGTEKTECVENDAEKLGVENDAEKLEGIESDTEKLEGVENDAEKLEDVVTGTDETYENVDNIENEFESIGSVFGNYNLFKSNCEHFATWCVLGKQESFQVEQKRKLLLFPFRLSSGAAGVFSVLILYILQVLLGLFTSYGPAFPLLGFGVFYLLYLLHRYGELKGLQDTKCICSYCFEETQFILVIKFMWFLVSGTLLYMIIWACIPIYVIFIISKACIKWLYTRLKSPFACKAIKVEQLSEVETGEVIIFRHYGFKHFAIATKVTLNNSKSGKITVVHYNLVGPNTRVITEEDIKWPEQTLWRLDLRNMKKFPPNKVISRIRSRVGEKKWHWRSNRSEHVCYWAVKDQSHWQYYTTGANNDKQIKTKPEGKILSSLKVETAVVHLRNEIEIGDVVEFHVKNGYMKILKKNELGIVIAILDAGLEGDKTERISKLSLVVQTSKSIKTHEIDIDLNTDTLKVMKFHPVHCNPLEERAQRALLYEHMTRDQKTKLIEFCVLKESRISKDFAKIALDRKKMM